MAGRGKGKILVMVLCVLVVAVLVLPPLFAFLSGGSIGLSHFRRVGYIQSLGLDFVIGANRDIVSQSVFIVPPSGEIEIDGIVYDRSVRLDTGTGGTAFGRNLGFCEPIINTWNIIGTGAVFDTRGRADATRNDDGDWWEGSVSLIGNGGATLIVRRDGNWIRYRETTVGDIGMMGVTNSACGVIVDVGFNVGDVSPPPTTPPVTVPTPTTSPPTSTPPPNGVEKFTIGSAIRKIPLIGNFIVDGFCFISPTC